MARIRPTWTSRPGIGQPIPATVQCLHEARRPRLRSAGQAHRCAAPPDSMPPMRLSRLPPVRGCDRQRQRRHQSMPAGRGRYRQRIGAADRSIGTAPRPGVRRTCAPGARRDRRRGMHRLHAVHTGLPGGCHRGRLETDAYGDRGRVHGLWPLHPAVPGRLHLNGRNGGEFAPGRSGAACAGL